jgi:hypothetical protein
MAVKSLVSFRQCAHHNRLLSERVDPISKTVRQAIQEMLASRIITVQGKRLVKRPNGSIGPPRRVALHGPTFGAWLTKTHCEIKAASGAVPRLSYVQYTFGRKTDEPIHFYSPHVVGDAPGFSKIAWIRYQDYDDETQPFLINISGLQTLVSVLPAAGPNGEAYIDRVRRYEHAEVTFTLDWRDDPPPVG